MKIAALPTCNADVFWADDVLVRLAADGERDIRGEGGLEMKEPKVTAAFGNFSGPKTMPTDMHRQDEVIREDVRPDKGMMRIPDVPDLGVEPHEAARANHPHNVCELRHYKGTLIYIPPAAALPFYSAGTSGA